MVKFVKTYMYLQLCIQVVLGSSRNATSRGEGLRDDLNKEKETSSCVVRVKSALMQ